MIMIIAILYIILSYVIFDQQLKITFRKFSAPPPPPPPTPTPPNTESFLSRPAERGDTMSM